MNVIETKNLSKQFEKFTAVKDLNISVKKGEIYGFLGPNGSGKTTVIKMLCGLLSPTNGKASVLGFDSLYEGEKIRTKIGYMSQKFSLYDDLTVEENLHFYGTVYGLSSFKIKERTAYILNKLGLEQFKMRLSSNLSGGWKQRLAFGCAVIHEPEVVFLDEPTSGIDPIARRELWDIFFEYSAQGITLFLTTHYMDEAERCDKLGYIYLSKLIINGTKEEIIQDKRVTPQGYSYFELQSTELEKSLAFLKQQNFIKDATIFGHNVHILAQENLTMEFIKKLFQQNSLEVTLFRKITPSLEDAFVQLTRMEENNV